MPTAEQEHKAGFTISEAAAYLGIGETFLRTLIREKRCQAVRFGQRVIVNREELDRLRREGASGTKKIASA